MAEEKKVSYTPLPSNSLERGEYASNTWRVKVPEGTPKEILKEDRYWANNAQLLGPFDIVQVVALDGAWFVELMVMDKGPNWAKVEVMRTVEFQVSVSNEEMPDGYELLWKGPVLRWLVMRTSDKRQVNNKTLKTKTEATEWAQAHAKSMAA